MTLARLIEQLLKQGKSGDEIQSCFTSLLEVSIRLKEARDGKDEHGSDDAEDDSDNEEDEDEDDDTDNDDYDEVDVWSAFTRENASNTLSNIRFSSHSWYLKFVESTKLCGSLHI